MTVELTDRRTFTATVVGSDAPSDLAVLKVDAKGLPTVALGDSDHVRVGDVVLAVGNPMGVGQTVTMGIVSAQGRATGLGDGSFEDFIQTDAPIKSWQLGRSPGEHGRTARWHQLADPVTVGWQYRHRLRDRRRCTAE